MRPNRDATEIGQVGHRHDGATCRKPGLNHAREFLRKENDAFLRQGSFRGLALLSIF